MGDSTNEEPEPDCTNADVLGSSKKTDHDDAGGQTRAAGAFQGGNVSIRKLFSMADGWDVLLMVLGTLAACVRGSASFVNMLLFGKIFESFGQSTGDPRSNFDSDDFPDKLLKVHHPLF